MLHSATTSASAVQPTLEGEPLTPRRIRHITGIQIRNLTPFPVRDAFTSAISQPVEQLDLNAVGITDDIAATLTRVRSRRISTTSTATRRSLKREEGAVEQDIIVPTDTVRGRKPSGSRITFTDISTSPSNAANSLLSSRSSNSFRSNRARTNSVASSSSISRLGASLTLGSSSGSISIPPLLPNNSQSALEKVFGSRLVETFITVTVPPAPRPTTKSSLELPTSPSTSSIAPLRSAPASKSAFSLTPPSPRIASKHSRDASNSSMRSNGRFPPDSAPPTKTTFKTFPKKDDRTANPQSPRLNGSAPPAQVTSVKRVKSVSSTEEDEEQRITMPATPIYFSPVHRPSTNPFFALDPRSGQDIPFDYDIGGPTLKVELWGRTSTSPMKARLMQEEKSEGNDDKDDWKLLDEWNVDLDRLIPVPNDLDVKPKQFSSNTLVFTLQPPGQDYYFAPSVKTISRPPSPSAGYTSDPESEIRKVKQVAEQPGSGTNGVHSTDMVPLLRRRRQKGQPNAPGSRDLAKTVTWQELFNLVSKQSLIADNQSILDQVVTNIDSVLAKDENFPLRREVSERETRLRELRNNHVKVLDKIAQRKQELEDRTRRLQERAELLASASEAIVFDSAANVKIEEQRSQLVDLRNRTASTRTGLLSTLTTIFPIELYSPPDLLFTILDVPLPIPLTANDPAPPLTLPEHKDVTDEAIATALGYVAQVVQILAAYMGKTLMYPITCVGSRSLIRDGISAMVGPRMFPLFSKGVDTYRFEYGVFLLNKNIEILMVERDLRAMDMRHTLPNLKNLLLTLSHDTTARPFVSRRVPSPASSTTGLETPPRSESPSDEAKTPKASHMMASQMSGESTTPTASGANTPTASTEESRKGKSSFLGFVPFTDFLRVRYPSTSQSSEKTIVKSEDASPDADEDQDDRMTIHGIVPDSGVQDSLETRPVIGGGVQA